MNLLDYLTPQASGVAASATDSALNQAAARPFNVVLSVEQGTQLWIAGLLIMAAVMHVYLKK